MTTSSAFYPFPNLQLLQKSVALLLLELFCYDIWIFMEYEKSNHRCLRLLIFSYLETQAFLALRKLRSEF